MKVVTRFAPSPTGYMHVGSVRTALFAWLFARQNNGDFILRIEDTDKAREVEGSVQHIQDSLRWLGIDWDFGPEQDGPFGSCTQSQRLEVYQKYAQGLYEKGLAYADPYSREELDAFRKQADAEHRPFLYRNHRPENPPQWNGSQPLRLKTPEIKSYRWRDAVRGELSAGPEALDDFILMKSDGYPTYNFAHIVDDHEMGVTQIFRADEFISSTPRFLSLYEAMDITPPTFVTLPPILGASGGKKLGKRDGAKDILDYKEDGYLPDALLNFLATLGWNDGTEQEVFTRSELLEKFSIQRIQKAGARFDMERLTWLNGQHIRKLSLETLSQIVADYWPASAKEASDDYRQQVLSLVHDRLKFLQELGELTDFFFQDIQHDPELLAKKIGRDDATTFLDEIIASLETIDFTEQALESSLRELVDKLNTSTTKLFGLVRVAITGRMVAPGLFETMMVLGKDTTLQRLRDARSALA